MFTFSHEASVTFPYLCLILDLKEVFRVSQVFRVYAVCHSWVFGIKTMVFLLTHDIIM